MAIMVIVGQHEEISKRAPRFCVAYQAPHTVAAKASNAVAADGTHAVAGDGSHAVAGDGSHTVAADQSARACAVAADRRARRRGPGPPQMAPHVPHIGGEKKLQSFNASSCDSPLSPRVSKCPFSLLPLNAQLTSSRVLVRYFSCCGWRLLVYMKKISTCAL